MNDAEIMQVKQEAIKNAAAGGNGHAPFPIENDTTVDNGEDIEEGEENETKNIILN